MIHRTKPVCEPHSALLKLRPDIPVVLYTGYSNKYIRWNCIPDWARTILPSVACDMYRDAVSVENRILNYPVTHCDKGIEAVRF